MANIIDLGPGPSSEDADVLRTGGAALDAFASGVVEARRSSPVGGLGQGTEDLGRAWIVQPTGTGAWATHDNSIAVWVGAEWLIITPVEGMSFYVQDENRPVRYNGSAWVFADQFMRSDAPTAGTEVTVDQLLLEGGDHRISANDGGGNFNLRIAHKFENGAPRYTDSASAPVWINISHDNTDNPLVEFRMAPRGVAGEPITFSATLRFDLNGVLQYQGNNVWHAGNHGPGSGSNADLLDDQEGAFYRNASNMNAGTLLDPRIPLNIPRLDQNVDFLGRVIANRFRGEFHEVIADDASATFDMPARGWFFVHTNNHTIYGLLIMASGGSNEITGSTRNMVELVGPLTGATGTDGDFSYSVVVHTLHLENRTGAPLTVTVTPFGD